MSNDLQRMRWRLILGSCADDILGKGLTGTQAQIDEALSFLYDRELKGEQNQMSNSERSAGLGESTLSVPDWINAIHELFPKKTIERLEKDAMERYQLDEMVTNPEVLQRAKPNTTLLKAVLRTKHLMNQEVMALARQMVRRVINELLEKMVKEIRQSFSGSVDRRHRSFLKVAKNFDAKQTIQRNLKNIDPDSGKMFLKDPYFVSRVRNQADKWQVIILVDQSGSMMDSVIFSAITASIFWGLKSIQTHLAVFDTNIVDMTKDCSDPVEILMKVQLGGGTDIAQAVEYSETLVTNPRKTIIVLISDFYEGGSLSALGNAVKRLCDSGVTFLGLAALDMNANPVYDKGTASYLMKLGAHVASMTPGELAEWVAEKVG